MGRKRSVLQTEIDLCFKALGIPCDATPDQVERAFAFFMDRARLKLLSSDPIMREQARSDMVFVAHIHERLTQGDIPLRERCRKGDGRGDGALVSLSICLICFLLAAFLSLGAWLLVNI